MSRLTVCVLFEIQYGKVVLPDCDSKAVREHKPEDAARAAGNHIEFVRQGIEDKAQDEARRSAALRRLGELTAPAA